MKLCNTRKYLSLILVFLLCLSMSVTAFAAEERIVSNAEIEAMLESINSEYGTNIHALSYEELIALELPVEDYKPMTLSELTQLENTLRNIAENQIPKFMESTKEAETVLSYISVSEGESIPFDGATVLSDAVTATKEIEYATAGAVAYTSKTIFGKTIWGEIQHGFCVTDTSQATWFSATNPTVTRTDSNRTLYWVGVGSYYSNINGTQYYLYSGTQYASMPISDYT